MLQRFRLDRPVGAVYLGLWLVGCHPGLPPLVSPELPPADQTRVAGWVGATVPRQGWLDRFTWLYQDEKAAKGGRGSARIAAPDTLRFDFAGSLGIGRGAAFVVGDTAQWVVPERSVEDLVPSFPLLWAMLGVAMSPSPDASVSGVEGEGRAAWRYVEGADTVEYLRVSGDPARLSAEVRHGGKVTGRTEVTVRADGAPIKARLTVPSVPAKLEITFYATVPTPSFPASTWTPPEP
ncbi:MAG TPA: hypothetical protein VNH46_09690 [Gemmatimonadales bacterium]|nr:hypothetical protein [Gemmatimonadales bacterium]